MNRMKKILKISISIILTIILMTPTSFGLLELQVFAEDTASYEGGTVQVETSGGSVVVTAVPDAGYDLCTLYYTKGGEDIYIDISGWASSGSGYTITIDDSAARNSVKARFLNNSVWDGCLDVSWYSKSSSVMYISTPAQLAGLAAIVNGLYNTEITRDMIKGDISAIDVTEEEHESAAYYGMNMSTSVYHYGADNFNGKTVFLTSSVDMGGIYDSSSGTWSGEHNYMPIGGEYLIDIYDSKTKLSSSFNGTFDGQGFTVANIYCERYNPGANYGDGSSVGLFGRIGVHDNDPVSLRAYQPAVRNVIVTGYISARRSVGGIVGKTGKTQYNNYPSSGFGSLIECCANYATIKGTDAKGTAGICGAAWNGGIIRNCYNIGSVTSSYAGPCGGIAGYNENTIINCYNIGQVTNTANGRYSEAIGSHNGGTYTIENCYWLSGTSQNGGYYNLPTGCEDQVIEMTSASVMKTTGFVEQLNGNGRAFVYDSNNENNGYPVLRITQEHVYDKAIDITFDDSGMKKDYVVGAALDTSGLKIFAGFADGSKERIKKYTVAAGDISSRIEETYSSERILLTKDILDEDGNVQVNISGTYDDLSFSQDYTISVNTDVTLTDLDVSGVTVRTYVAGDDPDVSGSTVVITYKTGNDEYEKQTVTDFDVTADVTDGEGHIGYGASKLKVSYEMGGVTLSKDIAIRTVAQIPAQTEDGTCIIDSAEDMVWFSAQVNEHQKYSLDARLEADVDMTSLAMVPVGTGGRCCYAGTFDGNGYSVTLGKFLSASLSGFRSGLALFGYTKNADIKDLTIKGTVSGSNRCAGIIAQDTGYSTVENCTNYADITAASGHAAGIAAFVAGPGSEYRNNTNAGTISAAGYSNYTNATGGILGDIYNTEVQAGVYESVVVAGNTNTGTLIVTYGAAGGITGQISNGQAAFSSNTNKGDVSSKSGAYIGGILGRCNTAVSLNIAYCINNGDITSGSYAAGGITGGGTVSSRMYIDNCFNTGYISAKYAVGGISGYNVYELRACYNRGNVYSAGSGSGTKNNTAGGIVGYNGQASVVKGVYSTGTVTGRCAGGIIGYADDYISGGNGYYLESGASSASGGSASSAYVEVFGGSDVGKREDAMMQPSFVSLLNGDTSRAFATDSEMINDGFPVLMFQGTDTAYITGYQLYSMPSKIKYVEGQKFDPAGMEILALYSDDTSQSVSDYEISFTDELTKDITEIIITVGDENIQSEFQIAITVTDDVIELIKVSRAPTRTVYNAGEKFDPSGMEVQAVYLSGKSRQLSEDEYICYSEPLKASDIWVTITYSGTEPYNEILPEATWNITVTESETIEVIDGVYQIRTADDLRIFAAVVNEKGISDAKAVVLADIDATGVFVPIGRTQDIAFTGSIDGKGHTITLDHSTFDDVFGLVNYAGNGTHISNLTVAGMITAGNASCGAIVGSGDGVTIENCINAASITGDKNCGGIAGTLIGGSKVTGCENRGILSSGSGCLGGMAGFIGDSTITDCINSTDITNLYRTRIGGIAGYSNGGEISGCTNNGIISCSAYSGGIIGDLTGGEMTISGCTNNGSVNSAGNMYTGGIIGRSVGNAAITKCDNTGAVSGSSYIGGVAGSVKGSVTDSTNSGNVTASGNYAGGIAGALYGAVSGGGNTADITGAAQAGGIAGQIYTGSISGAVAVGRIKTTTSKTQNGMGAGGIAGYTQVPSGLVLDECRFTGVLDVSGNDSVYPGGLVGFAATDVTYDTSSYTLGVGSVAAHPIGFMVGEAQYGQAYLQGDVNGNGFVNMADAQLAYDIGMGMYTECDDYEELKNRADVNGDGEVNALDARAVQVFVHTGSYAGD